jgi:hypothetical protein
MKRLLISLGLTAVLGSAAVWAAVELSGTQSASLPSLMPTGALLYLEAKDFHGLLGDWNASAEKRAWLSGDNYQAFSRSRLFSRLSQAQDEFSTTAGLPADAGLLSAVAGKESALGIFDIGNLEFVYVTRMDEAAVEATPLWQVRGKFDQRTVGTAQFYVHKDAASGRTAAFGALNGWLVVATRDDLAAGVMQRLQGGKDRSLPDESWYAGLMSQARSGDKPDLRLALNLEKIVATPYFRSYWVQRNITEMKLYGAALSDLRRSGDSYREERLLLRKPAADTGATPAAPGSDVAQVTALTPENATFSSAQAGPTPESVLAALREDVLERRAEQAYSAWSAPPAPVAVDAGTASMLETQIDQAPQAVAEPDQWLALRKMLAGAAPTAMLQVFEDRRPVADGVFVGLDAACALTATTSWDEAAVQDALMQSMGGRLTAGKLGERWVERKSAGGTYAALDGRVGLYEAVRGKTLMVATNAATLESMLAAGLARGKVGALSGAGTDAGVTYAAVYRHSAEEQKNFRLLFTRLDQVGHPGAGEDHVEAGTDPAFFTGNLGSLDRAFAAMTEERVEERDLGARVTQTVTYRWTR